MEKLKDYPIALLLTGLFLVLIIGFGTRMAANYGRTGDFIDTEYVDVARIEAQVNQTAESAEAWSNAFRSDNPFVATGALILFSVWGIINLIWDVVDIFFTIFFDIVQSLFGIPPIVTATVTAVIIITLIFLIWRTMKQGE